MLTRKQHDLLMFIDRHLKASGISPSFEEMRVALGLRSKSGIHRLISSLEERGFLQRRHNRARALEVIRLPGAAGRPTLTAVDAPEPDGLESGGAESGGAESGGAESGGVGADIPGHPPPPGFSPTVIRGDFTPRLSGVRTAKEVGAVELPLYGRIAAGLPIEALRDTSAQIEVPAAMVATGEHYALEVAGDSMAEAGILEGDVVIVRKGDTAENGQIVVALVDENEVTLKRLRRRGNSVALEPANARYEVQIFPADRVRVQGRMVALLRRYS